MPKTIIQQCKSCQKDFRGNPNRRTCSKECADKERDKRGVSILHKFFPDLRVGASTILDKINSSEWRIADERVIDYPDSPTGKAFIGVAKAPLQLAEGFGYKGILLQTDNREFVQCHECGKWMASLGGTHIVSHNMTAEEYKDKHGLLQKYALVSDSLSDKLSQNAHTNHDNGKFTKNGVFDGELAKKVSVNAQKARRKRRLVDNVQHNNKHGFCEQQLGYRLVEYIRKYRNLPSRSQKGEGLSISIALKRRYGTTNDGFKHYGLPERFLNGSRLEYLAPDGASRAFSTKGMDMMGLYDWMVEHTPILQGDLNVFAQKDLPITN